MSGSLGYLGLFLVLATVTTSAGQEPDGPLDTDLTEQVEVRFVILDAVVIDSRGRTVPDLGKDDFELFLDGRKMPVDTVDVSCPAGRIEDPLPVKRGERRPAPPPTDAKRRIVLALEYRQLSQAGRVAALDRLRDAVHSNHVPGDEIMVVALTRRLRVEQPFTTDKAEVLGALDRMERDLSLWHVAPIDPNNRPDLSRGLLFEVFEGLISLIELLGTYEGSKVIVLVSDMPGFEPDDPFGGRSLVDTPVAFHYDTHFDRLAALAAGKRTAIYTTHARGLQAFQKSSDRLARLAIETGGRFVERTNDLSLAYAKAQRDLTCRYAIGFYDRGTKGERPHRVSLSVRRAGHRVIHPKLYRFGSGDEHRAALDRIAYIAPAVFRDEQVHAALLPVRPAAADRWRAVIAMRFPVGVSRERPNRVEFGAKLERRGQAVAGLDRWLSVEPESERTERWITYVASTELPPGDYELSIVVNDPEAEGPRSATHVVNLPGLPDAGIVVAAPLLLKQTAASDRVQWEAEDNEGLEPLLAAQVEIALPLTAVTSVCRLGNEGSGQWATVRRVLRGLDGGRDLQLQPEEILLEGEGEVACRELRDTLPAGAFRSGPNRFEVAVRGPDGAELHGAAEVTVATAAAPDPVPAVEPVVDTPAAEPATSPYPPPTAGPAGAAPDLSRVLARLGRVAKLYAEGALEFTCDETIRYKGLSFPQRRVRYHYVYRVEDGELRDYRRSTEIGAEKDRDETIRYDGPAMLLRPYSWMFPFHDNLDRYVAHELKGVGEALGRPAVLVGIRPEDPGVVVEGLNDWVGTVWVDRETYQPLKVESYSIRSHGNKRELERRFEAARGNEEVSEYFNWVRRFTTYFGVEKNGMRLPSRVLIEMRRYQIPVDKSLQDGVREYFVRQDYSNYRFYSVRTSEEISRFVLGD